MPMNKNFHEFLMSMMETGNRQLNYNDELILDDNVEDRDAATDAGRWFGSLADRRPVVYENSPIKLMFTMTLLCTRGTLCMRINLQEYEIGANEMLVILPHAFLDYVYLSADAQIAMWSQSSDQHLSDNTLLGRMIEAYVHAPWIFRLTDDEVRQVLDIYRMARQIVANEQLSYKGNMLHGLTQVVAAYMMNFLDATERQTPRKPQSRITEIYQQFLALVLQHHAEQRSVAYYADRLCITPKYLTVAVQQASGRTASQWIRDHVILDAKAMILSGNYTIQQVADHLHFANPSFFGKYFKEAVGCAPGKYEGKVK